MSSKTTIRRRAVELVWNSCKIVGTFGGIIGVLLIFNWAAHYLVYSGDIELFDRVKAMEVQLNDVGRIFEDVISLVKREFDERMGKKWEEANMKLKSMKGRSDAFEKFMDGLENSRGFLTKEEFGEFFEDFIKERDYAFAGRKVCGDSEVRLVNQNRVSAEAEKMIMPSLWESRQCFPLKREKVCGDHTQGCHCTKL